jgi:hypothetical protein
MTKFVRIMLSLAIVGTLSFAIADESSADLEAYATAHVLVMVNSNVGVQASTPIVDAGVVQTGDFTATATFAVQANKEQLRLSVDASDLYKGDDPDNADVAPIALNDSEGATVDPSNANPLGGLDNIHPSLGHNAGPVVDGFPTTSFDFKDYESSQNGIWDQSVDVTVAYNQPDPLKPMGEYSGVIRLCCMIIP